MKAPCFSRGQLEELAKLLGDEVTGSTLSPMLEQVYLQDKVELSTKWKRIFYAFATYQNARECSNQIMRFIQLVLEPARYMDNSIHYHEILSNVSAILSFVG